MPQFTNTDVMSLNLNGFENNRDETLQIASLKGRADMIEGECSMAILSAVRPTVENAPNYPANQLATADISASQEALNQTVKNLHDYIQNQQRQIQIEVNDKNGHTLIKVLNSQTNTIVRQFSSEDLLVVSRRLMRMR